MAHSTIGIMTTQDFDGSRVTPETSLVDAVEISVENNEDVNKRRDAATIVGAYKIAGQIDNVLDLDAMGQISDPQTVTKALYLLPHLQNFMRDLLSTPVSRVNAEAKRNESGQKDKGNSGASNVSKLSQLRNQETRRGRSA